MQIPLLCSNLCGGIEFYSTQRVCDAFLLIQNAYVDYWLFQHFTCYRMKGTSQKRLIGGVLTMPTCLKRTLLAHTADVQADVCVCVCASRGVVFGNSVSAGVHQDWCRFHGIHNGCTVIYFEHVYICMCIYLYIHIFLYFHIYIYTCLSS